MSGIPLMARKVIMGREVMVPKHYRGEIIKELTSINIRREIILSCALMVMVAIILTVEVFGVDTQEKSLYVSLASYKLHILLLLISLAFIALFSGPSAINKKSAVLQSSHILINGLVLAICAAIAINNELAAQRPFAYITAMFCIGSVVLMPAVERIWIFIVPWVIYQVGLLFSVHDLLIIVQNFIFVTFLMALSLLISSINYSAYIHSYLDRKTIEENHKELDRLYKITEQNLVKRTEELNQTIELEKIRTAFLANISHELRTPLNIIYSAEQLLECTIKSAHLQANQSEVSQYMRIMKQNCHRLTRLIVNLIDITKIDAGYLEINPKNCDVVKLIEDISLSVAEYIKAKDISLTFDTEMEEKNILCDPEKIERIVLNLLSNAVKFTPEGGKIFVCVYNGDDGIAFSIKDTGIGIPQEMGKMIFERFEQVDKTSTRAREGSGIGLAIVKSLVEMHGGCISIKSSLGEGSEFIVELPAIKSGCGSSCGEYRFINPGQSLEKVSIEFSDIYD